MTIGGVAGHRSEVYRGSHHLPFKEGDVRWFGFSLMLGSSFGSGWGNGNQTVVQWKNDGTGSAPIDMRILEDGRLAITDRRVYRTPKIYWSTPGPVKTQAWHDFQVGIKFSSDPGVGYIEVRYNDADQKTLSGDLRTYTDTLKAGYASYIKQGYYSGGDMGFAGVVYHDAMRVGTTREQVALPAR